MDKLYAWRRHIDAMLEHYLFGRTIYYLPAEMNFDGYMEIDVDGTQVEPAYERNCLCDIIEEGEDQYEMLYPGYIRQRKLSTGHHDKCYEVVPCYTTGGMFNKVIAPWIFNHGGELSIYWVGRENIETHLWFTPKGLSHGLYGMRHGRVTYESICLALLDAIRAPIPQLNSFNMETIYGKNFKH